ncbi:hypothetical protein I553_3399 [Mycobacterium xenopi 4042]|uniref:Uncharacterized protein n=1 Tax=Mycobacterium xenopi 4042 TaxID=1299334 RepID=X8BE23_MYCXE|nr:hypothetical protein I553_3399 [Mycobacterium xenopi 4042]
MKLGVLAALDQRIGLRYTMAPMSNTETDSYLRHHLKLAGRDDTLFSDDAVTLVHQTSGVIRVRSTTSRCKPSSPHSPLTRPSSTNPPPAQPSPRSRRTEHHPTPEHHRPAGLPPAGLFHSRTTSPSTPPTCSS